ncbi:MAG: hypothetical protein F4029_14045 [Gammaproteobacteria bacterium]|nr:hypothetical protein [Gammaproteobacteria bacterium]MYK47340.1 hypothetical protein [Gammaproteobacteria bacterium]
MRSLPRGLFEWLAVALAELRTLRRLVRTWLFLALGIVVVGMAYWYYSYLHATSSFSSLNAGNALPRFTTAYFNSYVLWFFMAAMVFLAFDLRHRDQRERVAEAVDSRPLSNMALVAGRLCAVVLAICLPLFGVLLLTQAVGTIGRAVGWGVHPIEPVATFVFFFLDAVPALILWCGIVFAIAAGLRNRLVVAVAALGLIGTHMWTFAQVPGYLLPAVSLLYIHDNWASDLAPRLPDLATFLHRASMLTLAAGLAIWTAALYPRPDGRSRNSRLLLGVLPAALGALGIGTVVLGCIDRIHLRDAWLAAHQAAANEPVPRIEHLAANVAIDPGQNLRLDLEMSVQAPEDLSALLFSFNPGLEVADLRLDDIATPFQHEHGVLRVRPGAPLASGTEVRLTLQASGIPDPDFAYLDSVVDWRRESSRNAILWLGTAGGIFENHYVALMPAIRWLPVPGANLDDASRGHAPTVELTVDVPGGWLVAAPGRRETLGTGRYRFRPGAGVPKLGLFAARFERRAMEVDGVELELLLHPAHLRNLDYYANVTERLRSRLEQIFRDAEAFGIPYPYTGFSVVEVPAHLREYGGGHWLDTTSALPGLLLIKEHGFPYANVQLYNDPSQFANYPGGLDAVKIQRLEWMFSNDFTSGSALRAWSRNLVSFASAADGPGAHALDYVGEELARELFRNPNTLRLANPSMYTAHLANADAGFGATVVQMIDGLASDSSDWTGFRPAFVAQSSVWERALDASLAEMDFANDTRRAIGAFALRAKAVAHSIADGLGRDRTATLLATLRGHGDGTYDAAAFAAAVAAAGADIERLVGDWLNDTALPGFVVSGAEVERVALAADAQPQYEIRVHVRNDEPTPGLVRLSLGIGPQNPRSEPVRLDGNTTVEIGILSAESPQTVLLEPYLALNRIPLLIDLGAFDEHDLATREPFVGARSSTWLPATPVGIVIDDLDPGFSVERRREDTRLGGTASTGPDTREFDQGLPAWDREPGEWTRASILSGWGKYRRTVAGARSGDGSEVAAFSARLPTPGRWRLDFHVPKREAHMGWGTTTMYGTLGSFDMTLVADGKPTRVDFDGAAADTGWNKVGEFELAAPEVRLEISNRTDGEMVIADAIRWVPLD